MNDRIFKTITGNIYNIIKYDIYIIKYDIKNKIKLLLHFLPVTGKQYKRFTPVSWCSIEKAEIRRAREADERECSCKETQYPLGWRVIRIGGWTNRRKEIRKDEERCAIARA